MATKVCTKCGQEKDIELFVVRSKSLDGHAAECKECHRAHWAKKYREDIEVSRAVSRENAKKDYWRNPDKHRKRAREYAKENPDQVRETSLKWAQKNRDHVNKRQREYDKKHPDKKKQRDKNYREKHADELKIKWKENAIKNKDHIATYKHEYYLKHKDEIRTYKRNRYQDNIERERNKHRRYREENRLRVNQTRLNHIKSDPQARLSHNYRTLVLRAMGRKTNGSSRLKELLGCDMVTYRTYLESLWTDDMSWDNYGNGIGRWCIDHIICLANFDLTDWEQAKTAFNYKNTQPMWWSENCSKSNRYNGSYIEKSKLN